MFLLLVIGAIVPVAWWSMAWSTQCQREAARRPCSSAVPNSVGAMNRAVSDNPLGLGLVIVGAVTMAISVLLPLDEPTGAFRMVEENTLIQHGGWMLIALALGIAASGYRVKPGQAVVLCGIAAGLIVFDANDKGIRTLYPIGPDGNPITTQPGMVANLGIAIYVAGAGVAVALIGSVILGAKQRVPDASGTPGLATAATKKCPDCAETVLANARVCKHCGYRFAPSAPDAQEELAPGKSTKVRCHRCQHVQAVPLSQSSFVCAQCNTGLKRTKPKTDNGPG